MNGGGTLTKPAIYEGGGIPAWPDRTLGKTVSAIYDLQGDTLRVCCDLSGAGRPKEFKATAGTPLYLVTSHRKRD